MREDDAHREAKLVTDAYELLDAAWPEAVERIIDIVERGEIPSRRRAGAIRRLRTAAKDPRVDRLSPAVRARLEAIVRQD